MDSMILDKKDSRRLKKREFYKISKTIKTHFKKMKGLGRRVAIKFLYGNYTRRSKGSFTICVGKESKWKSALLRTLIPLFKK